MNDHSDHGGPHHEIFPIRQKGLIREWTSANAEICSAEPEIARRGCLHLSVTSTAVQRTKVRKRGRIEGKVSEAGQRTLKTAFAITPGKHRRTHRDLLRVGRPHKPRLRRGPECVLAPEGRVLLDP
jgi:hypothetical protein